MGVFSGAFAQSAARRKAARVKTPQQVGMDRIGSIAPTTSRARSSSPAIAPDQGGGDIGGFASEGEDFMGGGQVEGGRTTTPDIAVAGDRVGRRQENPSPGSAGIANLGQLQVGGSRTEPTINGQPAGGGPMATNMRPGQPGGEGFEMPLLPGGGNLGGMMDRIKNGAGFAGGDKVGAPGPADPFPAGGIGVNSFRNQGQGGPAVDGADNPNAPVDDPSTPQIEGPSATTATDELRRLNQALDAGTPAGALPAAQGAEVIPQDPAAGAVGLENLGAVVERRLGSGGESGGFGSAEAERFREVSSQNRADERARGVADIGARAARRGTSFTTIPTDEEGGLEERLQRAAGQEDLQLQNLIAQASFGGRNRAIDDAFRFNQSAFSNQQASNAGLGNLGGLANQLGIQGGPDLNQATAGFGLQNTTQGGGIDPNLAAVLGQLFQGQAA